MKIALLLRLSYSMQRDRLIGIFNAIQPTDDWDIQILQTESDLRSVLTQSDQPPDGIITYTPREDETRHLIASSRIPIAIMGVDKALRRARKRSVAFVMNDNESVGSNAAAYLTGLGNFRAFAFVPYQPNRPWSVWRQTAFVAALAAVRRSCLVYESRPTPQEDFRDLTRFVAALDRPAAVFTANDERAQDVLRAAKQAKVKVPDELAVLGVDDDELICERSTPPLSSVRLDAVRQGFEAAQSLKTLLKSRRPAAFDIQVPIVGVTERATTRIVSPAAHLINRATLFIRSEYRRGLTPADVAAHLGISRTLLFLRFRQYARASVAETIRNVRLDEVKRLLRTTDRKVSGIFASVGFKSPIHATRLFRQATGMTPLEWRKAARTRRKEPSEQPA